MGRQPKRCPGRAGSILVEHRKVYTSRIPAVGNRFPNVYLTLNRFLPPYTSYFTPHLKSSLSLNTLSLSLSLSWWERNRINRSLLDSWTLYLSIYLSRNETESTDIYRGRIFSHMVRTQIILKVLYRFVFSFFFPSNLTSSDV